MHISKILIRLMLLTRSREQISSISGEHWNDRIDRLFDLLEISCATDDEDLKRIPKTGPFIAISNHPFGGLEDLLLLRALSSIRPDIKFLPNPVLQEFGIPDHLFLEDSGYESFTNSTNVSDQKIGSCSHLQNGGCLCIFPGGNLSSYNLNTEDTPDKRWRKSVLKGIRNSRVPVVPVFIKGTDNLPLHLSRLIYPTLKTSGAANRFLNNSQGAINARISNPIPVKDQDEFCDIDRYSRYLRARTYALETSSDSKRFFTPANELQPEIEEIISPIPVQVLQNEVDQLEDCCRVFEVAPFKVFCAPASAIPQIIIEIGRLREITFRQVGEGTNKKVDLDEFDIYYRHLFIWDSEAQKIVGAYRIGMGREIFGEYGIKGFYIFSLYRISKGFHPIMNSAIELGRSFIISEYQKKPLSLFCLWKGILYFLLKHPEYRYLVGPVSLSSRFSDFSRSLMTEYITLHYFDNELAKFVKPRNAFKNKTMNVDAGIFLEGPKDLRKLDKHIRDVCFDEMGMPVLLKKYLGLNGKIVAFNLDAKFNDALDGLLVLDFTQIPKQVLVSLSKEIDEKYIDDRLKASPTYDDLVNIEI